MSAGGILLGLALGAPVAAEVPEGCVAFVGDIALGRGVSDEIARRGSPWQDWPESTGTVWVGNLEGSVAKGPCVQPDPAYCLGFAESQLDHLSDLGAVALSVENNHAGDHGMAILFLTLACKALALALGLAGAVSTVAGPGGETGSSSRERE